jgi:RNA polymerase sigma-70 factor (ECF subfamily)
MAGDPAPSAKRPHAGDADPSDHSLLERVRRGSQAAATKLYYRYAKRIRALAKVKCSRGLARCLDPEDIVQTVFHRFFAHARCGDYDVPPGEELWKLLVVIALHKIQKAEAFHRASKRDLRHTLAGRAEDAWARCKRKPDQAARDFLRLTVAEALGRLPATHRIVVQRRIEGYEVAEIAQQIGRSQRTVERLVQEARKKLRTLLHADD